ncbi:MAG: HAMP domain-containing sensor histidine kinase [Chitinophagaceae bacterium]
MWAWAHFKKEGSFTRISSEDKGPGIVSENLPHLFERYYGVKNTRIRGSGLGPGLYISAEIIKKHKGEFGVKSTLGQGSIFWFTVPP